VAALAARRPCPRLTGQITIYGWSTRLILALVGLLSAVVISQASASGVGGELAVDDATGAIMGSRLPGRPGPGRSLRFPPGRGFASDRANRVPPGGPVLTGCARTLRNAWTSQHTTTVNLHVRRTAVDVAILPGMAWWGSNPGIPTP
jgi:hypothetical protein